MNKNTLKSIFKIEIVAVHKKGKGTLRPGTLGKMCMYSKKRGTIGENVYSKRRSVSKKRSIPVGGTLGITRTTLGMGLGEMFFLACKF